MENIFEPRLFCKINVCNKQEHIIKRNSAQRASECQDLVFFRDAFVVGKMDSDINACGNAMFGWRSWTMWSIRSRAKDANKSLTDAASFIYTQYIYI